ncbi:MAG: carboxypeptidase regulatory-like domain-containing protein [Polyangiaceae bacterium]|nr:carboxypeptidase regulatory-like domain-containing protein [Polyangiaceae bacterium]
MTRATFFAVLSTFLLILGRSAHAEPAPMTRDAIIALVKPAVGHGYYFGHNTWTTDGSRKGTCSGNCTTSCSFSGTIGTDCSGLVGKAWQVPGPLPVTQDKDHFSTELFRFKELHWTRIERTELKKGDALVYRNAMNSAGHIVLFDKLGDDGRRLWVYEARGCAQGVVYNLRDLGPEYVSIRRKNLIESGPITCGIHGRADAFDGCSCDPGYAGASCETCAAGFYGYPSCVREGSSCEPSGAIQCGNVVPVTSLDSTSNTSSHACNDSVAKSEVIYEFRPHGRGQAHLALEGVQSGLELRARKQRCDAESCLGAASSNLTLDYSEGDVFYIAIEGSQTSGYNANLNVNCEVPKQAWVGDACQSDADCDMSFNADAGTKGFCFKQGTAAFCSLPCERLCPDLVPDKAQTFCVQRPNQPQAGMCVSRSDRQNSQCGAISGTVELLSQRFGQTNKEALSCVPLGTSGCSLHGSVVAFDTTPERPVEGASVHLEGVGFTADTKTDVLGNYAATGIPCGSVSLTLSAPGFLTEHLALTLDGSQHPVSRLKALPEACAGLGSLTGSVFDTLTSAAVEGAQIQLFSSLGRAEGTPLAEATSGASGMYELSQVPAGHYTARIEAPSYSPLEKEVIVCGGRTQASSDFFVAKATQATLSFVLDWQRPSDLDLHLQLPNGEEVYFDDLCRGSSTSFPYATLDVDHRYADGPESLSITALIPGRYTLFVHNYSQDFTSSEPSLTESDAQVSVFGQGGKLLGRFPVPSRGSGLYWDVLSFEGLHPEKLTPIQRLQSDRLRPEDYVQACRP